MTSRPWASAFSLLELLVVIAIVLVLTTLYWRSTAPSRAHKAEAACRTNLEKLFLALEIYSHDNGAKFPAVAGAQTSEPPLDLLVPRFTADTSLFTCPGSGDATLVPGQSLLKGKISYAYYMGLKLEQTPDSTRLVLMSDRQLDTLSKAPGQPVFCVSGKSGNHGQDGGNFLFCDGHAQASPPAAPFSLVLTQGLVLLNPKR
jgi:prepilin-type N-terminal cleavage/methylation domain-containing protein/prepilin-type processing-associated H-X9-DG protein